jgi:hypothetical protein
MAASMLATAPAGAQATGRQSAAAPPAGTDSSKIVTLPTGERVMVQSVGGHVSAATASAGGSYATIGQGGHMYVIPGRVFHALGTGYHVSDFDVTNLAGITRAQAPPKAHFPMFELTVKGINMSGAPDTGDLVSVSAVDDGRKFSGSQSFFNGSCKFSVPAGTYAAWGLFAIQLPTGVFGFAQAELAEFTVSGNGTITADARTATSQPSAKPPTSAKLSYYEASTTRVAAGPNVGGFTPSNSISLLTQTAGSLFVSPTNPVTVGALHYDNYWAFQTGRGPSGTPATYGLRWAADGVIPVQQAFAPSLSSLAGVDTSYGDEGVRGTGLRTEYSFYPWQSFAFSLFLPVRRPSQQTEYVSAVPGLAWSHSVAADQSINGFYVDNQHVYAPGQQGSTEWFGVPQASGFAEDTVPGSFFFCQACRQGDTLELSSYPWVDPSGHLGFADGAQPGVIEQTSAAVYANGSLVGQQSGTGGLFPLPAGPSTVQVVLQTQRIAPWSPLSTSTQTAWSFTSATQTTDGLSPGWQCQFPKQDCAPLPLVTASYGLPLDLSGNLTTGPTVATITLGHVAGSPSVPMTSAAVDVSVDGGTTWRPASVTPNPDGMDLIRFTTRPAGSSDGYLAIRVNATDAAGSSLSQTILQAARLVDPSTVSAASTASGAQVHAACPAPRAPEQARCLALIVSPPLGAARVAGYGAADLVSAYALPVSQGAGQTVAVVDAYDDPNAEADLAVYRARYGLPACTSASGCFKKVDQHGGSHLPPGDANWAVEESLDLDMVSAACPLCHIVLVEARTAFVGDLGIAVNTAAAMGAASISNSYGLEEFAAEGPFAHFYNHPGHALTVSSGDFGFGPAQFPGNLATVTSVGGTTLKRAPGTQRGWSESVWSHAGSGCSAYIAKPHWQTDANCPMRTVADVSTVADGLAVYDTYQVPGWVVVSGTSAGSPLVAGVYALAGNTAGIGDASGLYAHAGQLYDITSGSNGFCGGDYLCTGLPGYDAPTGNGTPNGAGGF